MGCWNSAAFNFPWERGERLCLDEYSNDSNCASLVGVPVRHSQFQDLSPTERQSPTQLFPTTHELGRYEAATALSDILKLAIYNSVSLATDVANSFEFRNWRMLFNY